MTMAMNDSAAAPFDTVRRRQGRAALALADLLTQDLPELSWCTPRDDNPQPALRGRRDGEDSDKADRLDVVDEWADFLCVTPEWVELAGGSGEYVATGEHMGVQVSILAWLSEAPGMAGA